MMGGLRLGDFAGLDQRLHQTVVAADPREGATAQEIGPRIAGPQAGEMVVPHQDHHHRSRHHGADAMASSFGIEMRMRSLQPRANLKQHLGSRQARIDALQGLRHLGGGDLAALVPARSIGNCPDPEVRPVHIGILVQPVRGALVRRRTGAKAAEASVAPINPVIRHHEASGFWRGGVGAAAAALVPHSSSMNAAN